MSRKVVGGIYRYTGDNHLQFRGLWILIFDDDSNMPRFWNPSQVAGVWMHISEMELLGVVE